MNTNEITSEISTSSMRVPRKKREEDDDLYPEAWGSLHDDDNTLKNEDVVNYDAITNVSNFPSSHLENIEQHNVSLHDTDNNTTTNTQNSQSQMKTIFPKPPSSNDDYPVGVIIPPSVTSDLLTGRLRNMLLQLPVDQINEALQEYDDAARMRDLNIRNHYAYFNGLLRRFLSVHEKVKAGLCTGPMGINLSDRVRERMKELVKGEYCTEEDMKLDDRVMAKLKLLSESEALLAFDELETVDRARIRNFGSYFMGIVNRYMRGERGRRDQNDSQRRDIAIAKRPGFAESSRRDDKPWNKSNNNRRSRSRSRSPPNKSRTGRYGNTNNNDNDNDRRRDLSRRDSDNKYNDRDYRDNDNYNRRDNDRHSNRNDSRTDEFDRYGRNKQKSNRDSSSYSPRKTNSFKDRSNRDFNEKENRSSTSVNYYSRSPRLDSAFTNNSNVGPSATNSFNNLYVQQQQTFQNHSFLPMVHGPVPGIIPPVIPNQAAVAYQPTFQLPPASAPQHSYAPGSFNPSVYQSSNAYPNMQQNNMAPNHAPPQNLFNTAPPQFQQQTVTPPSLNPLGTLAPANSGGLDILDIANMAQQFLNQQTYPQQPQPNIIPPQPPQALNYSTNTGTDQHQPYAINITNSKFELPVMVKLAVQNLIATGHIDGDLDAGLRRLLTKLPEPVALEALNNYASCDLSRVRNKTGYLGGILKKHHEKVTETFEDVVSMRFKAFDVEEYLLWI